MRDFRIERRSVEELRLFRRTVMTRQRSISGLSAVLTDPYHFRLRLTTQAGTYVKEFVHGDFGRTKPNLTTILNRFVDILELDVLVSDRRFVSSR